MKAQETPKKIQNETTGKAFFFTGLVLLAINAVIALAVGRAQVLMVILPVCIVFTTVGGALWMQARKNRQASQAEQANKTEQANQAQSHG